MHFIAPQPLGESEMIKCPYHTGVYHENLDLLVCHPKGKLNADKLNDIANCRECIQKAGLFQTNRFHNLTDITSIDLGFDDVHRICQAESRMRQTDGPIKACYLVPNDLLYGTIRMYQALIASSGVEVHVSRNIDELAKILGVDSSRLIDDSAPGSNKR